MHIPQFCFSSLFYSAFYLKTYLWAFPGATPQKSYREPSASSNDETIFDLKEADNNVDPLTNNSDEESDSLGSLEEYYPGYEEYFREYYDE